MSEYPSFNAAQPSDEEKRAQTQEHEASLQRTAIHREYGLRLEPTDTKRQLAEHMGIDASHIAHNDIQSLKHHAHKGRQFTGASWEIPDAQTHTPVIYKITALDKGTRKHPLPPEYVLKAQAQGSTDIVEKRWTPTMLQSFLDTGKYPLTAAETEAKKKNDEKKRQHDLQVARVIGGTLLSDIDAFKKMQDDRGAALAPAPTTPEADKEPEPPYPTVRVNFLEDMRAAKRTDDNPAVAPILDSLNTDDTSLKTLLIDELQHDKLIDDKNAIIGTDEAMREAQKTELILGIDDAISDGVDLTSARYTTASGALLEIIGQGVDDEGKVTYTVRNTVTRSVGGKIRTLPNTYKDIKGERLMEFLKAD